jgi:hypothetical protein
MKTYGGVDIQTHDFLSSALVGGAWEASRSCRFTPKGNSPPYGRAVVEALSYKPEGRWFDTRRDECIFSIYLILPAAQGPGVYSASNRNE